MQERPVEHEIDHGPLRACLIEMDASPREVATATGIALPKILRLLGVSGGVRRAEGLDGFDLVRLCSYAGLPLSAVVRDEPKD